jgi:hypothetical protein
MNTLVPGELHRKEYIWCAKLECLWTISIVRFLYRSRRFGDWLCLRNVVTYRKNRTMDIDHEHSSFVHHVPSSKSFQTYQEYICLVILYCKILLHRVDLLSAILSRRRSALVGIPASSFYFFFVIYWNPGQSRTLLQLKLVGILTINLF